MIRKKLLTIVCVAGILACGACFLPPDGNTPSYPPPPSPPPPHLRPELQGIKAIRVVVVDATETHVLDPSQIAQAVSMHLLEQTNQSQIHLDKSETLQPGDAVLRIRLQNTTAVQQSHVSGKAMRAWRFYLTYTATLTDRSGQTIWQRTDQPYDHLYALQTNDPAKAWQAPGIQRLFADAFAFSTVHEMLYDK
jgi:hypothetical protein